MRSGPLFAAHSSGAATSSSSHVRASHGLAQPGSTPARVASAANPIQQAHSESGTTLGPATSSANETSTDHDIGQLRAGFDFARISMHPGAARARAVSTANLIRQVHGESGTALDPAIRSAVESSTGRDLEQLRVHRSRAARAAAERLGANGFTIGADIFLGGQDENDSADARRTLLTHEAVHAAQQGGTRTTLSGTLRVSCPSDAAELQARQAATSDSASAALELRDRLRTTPIGIQRDITGHRDIGTGVFDINFTTNNGGPQAGEDGTVSFTPSTTSPESDAIRFIQIARAIDVGTGTPSTFAALSGGLATMDTMSTTTDAKKNIAGGFAVDQQTFPAPRSAKADPAVPPFYDVTGPPIAGNQTGVHRGKTRTAAVLEDHPGLPSGLKVNFVSTAKGADNGVFYGTALWGFETFTDKGNTKVKNEYHSFRTFPGETMVSALQQFDAHYNNPGSPGAPKK